MKKIGKNIIVTIISIVASLLSAFLLVLSISIGKIDNLSLKAKEESMFAINEQLFVVLDNNEVYQENNLLFTENDGVVSVASKDNNYIVGSRNRYIKKYDSTGAIVATSDEQSQNISKIVCADEFFYVMFSLNSKSSVCQFDYDLNKLSTRSFQDSLVRDIFVNDQEGTVSIVNEYGEYIITDYSLKNDFLDSSLDIFPSNVVITNNCIFAVNNSSEINKFDLEANLKWNYIAEASVYKLFSSNNGGVYFLDNEERSLHYINENGEEDFKYKSGVDTLTIVEIGEKVFIGSNSDSIQSASISTLNHYSFYKFLKIASIVILSASVIVLTLSLFKKTGKKALEKTKYVGKQLYKGRLCYLTLFPILILLILFCYYPTVNALKLAFFEYRPNSPDVFVGLDNFKYVLTSDYFTTGLLNLLKILVTDLLKSVIPTLFFAEIIASIMSKKFKYASRVMLYLPAILPGVTSLLIWKSGILGTNGVLNEVLAKLGFIREGINWLGNDATAIWSIVFIGFPWVGNYIILYGALMAIPKSYYDSCKIDGCSFFRRVFSIDVPLLKPQLRYLLLTSFIGSFQDFQRIYLTTGGANNTKTPMLGLYTHLQNQDLGYASAIGLIMFVVLFAATVMTFKVDTKED